MHTEQSLDGSIVLITGANRGLGRALVNEALARGADHVYAATRTRTDQGDPRVSWVPLDLDDPDSIREAAARVPELDLLINNAAVGLYDDLTDIDVLAEHLKVNVLGTAALTNSLLEALACRGGAVVNVSSLAGLANLPVMPSYSISKAALLSLGQAQRALFGHRGVRVQAVVAGPIDTDMTAALTIPKTDAADVAAAIYDGVARGAEEIFPDALSAQFADGWAAGPLKELERANAGLLPQPAEPSTGTDNLDYTTTLEFDRGPDEVFAAIADVSRWWLGEVTGEADHVGAEFTYRYQDLHESRQRVSEFVPGRRAVWDVIDSDLSFVSEADPWTGTRVVFDLEPSNGGTRLTFTHEGLTPQKECYAACSAGWDHFVLASLRQLVLEGVGVPL